MPQQKIFDTLSSLIYDFFFSLGSSSGFGLLITHDLKTKKKERKRVRTKKGMIRFIFVLVGLLNQRLLLKFIIFISHLIIQLISL